MVSPDIRAGVSLLIAALSAQGTSVIQNIEQIDRATRRSTSVFGPSAQNYQNRLIERDFAVSAV